MDTYFEIPFPVENDIIYQIGIYHKKRFIPFYIGQSTRNIGRLGDYISAKFTASTDFKVGVAIKYLLNKNYKIFVRYAPSKNRLRDEKRLIKENVNSFPLLNELKGYDYRTSNKNEIELMIHKFIDNFLEQIISKVD